MYVSCVFVVGIRYESKITDRTGKHLLCLASRYCLTFLFKVNGGNCLISWDEVQGALEYGGLGILNLEYMSWALQIRWLWLAKPFGCGSTKMQNFFAVALQSHVGNRNDTFLNRLGGLFGCCIESLAPNVCTRVLGASEVSQLYSCCKHISSKTRKLLQ